MSEVDFEDIVQNLESHKAVNIMAEFMAGLYRALIERDVPEQYAAYMAMQVYTTIMKRGMNR